MDNRVKDIQAQDGQVDSEVRTFSAEDVRRGVSVGNYSGTTSPVRVTPEFTAEAVRNGVSLGCTPGATSLVVETTDFTADTVRAGVSFS